MRSRVKGSAVSAGVLVGLSVAVRTNAGGAVRVALTMGVVAAPRALSVVTSPVGRAVTAVF
jgi:hypothetical protein